MLKIDRKYFEILEPRFKSEGKEKIFHDLVDYSQFLYESLYRYSGESYLSRSLRLTIEKILPLNPDLSMLIATVLISAMYSPRCDLKKIESLFGTDVCDMVESLGKINAIKTRYSTSENTVIARMFLTLASDIRVILIRLMDRIDNLETLDFKLEEKQKANAREILDVYVPISSQLGLYEITLQLEDLAFRYVYPQEYADLKEMIDLYLSKTSATISEAQEDLFRICTDSSFDVEVSGRIKSVFSIFKKLKKKSRSLEDIFDIYATRIILKTGNLDYDSREDIQRLYAILGLLHSKFEYLPDRFKDYVANPKLNGYQSLHTAIVGLNSHDKNKPTEIQIRTEKMHYAAEYGLAAHWVYKNLNGKQDINDNKMLEALRNLRNNFQVNSFRTASLKMDLYPDRIFVMTLQNIVKDLPKGATPVDFAYSISSEIGHTCYLAKVNGFVKPLDYQLENGDKVEILTDSKLSPKLSWLRFVVTRNARNLIRNFYRNLDRDDLLKQGIEEVNEILKTHKMQLLDENYSIFDLLNGKKFSMSEREDFFVAIGKGELDANYLLEEVLRKGIGQNASSENIKNIISYDDFFFLPSKKEVVKEKRNNVLIIGGESDLPYKLALCCKPKLSDQMVAFVTKSNLVSVHKTDCSELKDMGNERLLDVRLTDFADASNLKRYQVALNIEVKEVPGYIKELVEILVHSGSTIIDFSTVKKDLDIVKKRLIVDVNDDSALKNIVQKVGSIAGISRVYRM